MERRGERQTACTFIEKDIFSIRTLVLSNGLLEVEIFAGKGAEIHTITYLPKRTQFLLEIPDSLPAYAGLDLRRERLAHYSQHATGGWQDVVPGLGTYGAERIGPDRSGIAATLPWQYRLVEQSDRQVAVLLFVDLPVMPLRLEKQITLKAGGAGVEMVEKITNLGDQQACFTWTQHIALGGDFIVPGVQVDYPGCALYHAARHAQEGGEADLFTYDVGSVRMPDDEIVDLRRMPPRGPRQQTLVAIQRDLKWDFYTLYDTQKDIGVRLEWDRRVFPFLRCWYQNGPRGYSIALEPSNYGCHHVLEDCLAQQQYLRLYPGEAVRARLMLDVLSGDTDSSC